MSPGASSFEVQTETAWSPTVEMWDTILEKYPGVLSVFVAEEPGCDYYINTDENRRFYDYSYRVDMGYEGYIENKALSKIGLGERFFNKCIDVCECLSTKEVLDFYSNLVGREFISMEHLEGFYSVLSDVSDDSYYFGLHKYEPYYN